MKIAFLFALIIQRIFSESQIKELYSSIELENYVRDNDFLVVVYFYSDYECSRCLNGLKVMELVWKQMQYYAKFVKINCDIIQDDKKGLEQLPLCLQQGHSHLPSIISLTTGYKYTQENQVIKTEKIGFHGQLSPINLINYIEEQLPQFYKVLQSENDYYKFMNSTTIRSKIICLTKSENFQIKSKDTNEDYKPSLPVIFKTLSSSFRNQFDLALIPKSNQIIYNKFINNNQVKSKIIILDNNSEEIKNINDKNFFSAFNEISKFASDNHIIKQKFHLTDEDDSTSKLTIQIIQLSSVDYYKILDTQKSVLVFFTKSNQDSIDFQGIMKAYGTLMEYYEMNCDNKQENQFAIKTLKINKFPSAIFYQIGNGIIYYEQIINNANDAYLIAKNLQHIKFSSESIKLNYQREVKILEFILQSNKLKKLPLLYVTSHNYTKKNLIYKLMSQQFTLQKYYTFGYIDEYDQNIMDLFKIKELPYLGILKDNINYLDLQRGIEEFKLELYKGEWNALDIVYSSKQFVLELVEIDTDDKLQFNCNMKGHICMIGLFKESVDLDIQNQIKTLSDVQSKNFKVPNISFQWIDLKCFKYLQNIFKSTNDVLFVALDYTNQRYELFNDLFNEKNLNSFVQHVQNLKKLSKKFKEIFEIDEKSCPKNEL